MNYHRYIDVDVINGPGTRCTLFVSGCEHHCPGCYNACTWNPASGHLFTAGMLDRIVADLNSPRIKRRGLSLSGGDPLYPANCSTVLEIVSEVRRRCPAKDIWLWTGYRFEDLAPPQRAIVEQVDVLVDGRFEQALADPSLPFRGSSNQRIIDVAELGASEAPLAQAAPALSVAQGASGRDY